MKACCFFLLIGLRVNAQDPGTLAEALDLPGYNWRIEGADAIVMNDDPGPDTDYINFGSMQAAEVWLKVTVQGPGVLSCITGDLDRSDFDRISVFIDGTMVRFRSIGEAKTDFMPVASGIHEVSWKFESVGAVDYPVRCPLNQVKFTAVQQTTGEILGAPQLVWTTSSLFPWVPDLSSGSPPTRMLGGYANEWSGLAWDPPGGMSWLATTLPPRTSVRFEGGGWLNYLLVDEQVARFWDEETQSAELQLGGNTSATISWVQRNDWCFRLPSRMTLANVRPQPAAVVTLPEAIDYPVHCVLENPGTGPGWEKHAGGGVDGGTAARILAAGGLHFALTRPDYLHHNRLKFWWKVEGAGPATVAVGDPRGVLPAMEQLAATFSMNWEPGSVPIAYPVCYDFRPVRFRAPSGSVVYLDRLEYVLDSGKAWMYDRGLPYDFNALPPPDGDTLDLFGEYAFGGDPWAANKPPLPVIEATLDGSVRVAYQLPPWSTEDVFYWFEASSDLITWRMEGVPDRNNGNSETISIQISAEEARRFFRLRASRG